MNLPTAVTVARMALAPVVAGLAFVPSATARLVAFALYLAVAVSDWWDGHLARSRGEISDLGKVLDPLADKLFLACVLATMYVLQAPDGDGWGAYARPAGVGGFAFAAPGLGRVPLPWWVLLVVFAREVAMTVFRAVMQRRGVVIGASRSAKWKTGFQFTWMGTAYWWFFLRTWAEAARWDLATPGWAFLAGFTLLVGVVSMGAAVALTFWSLGAYAVTYGPRLRDGARAA